MHRDDAAVRVAEQVHALEAQVLSELLEVGRVVGDGVVARIGGPVGFAGPTRVDQHELELPVEAAEIGEVEPGEARAAAVTDERRALSGAPVGEAPAVGCRQPIHRPSTTRSLPARSGVIATAS